MILYAPLSNTLSPHLVFGISWDLWMISATLNLWYSSYIFLNQQSSIRSPKQLKSRTNIFPSSPTLIWNPWNTYLSILLIGVFMSQCWWRQNICAPNISTFKLNIPRPWYISGIMWNLSSFLDWPVNDPCMHEILHGWPCQPPPVFLTNRLGPIPFVASAEY